MKKLMITLMMATSFCAIANDEIALEATTHRVKSIGYDCGEFFKGPSAAPVEFTDKGVEFTRLDADKDLNFFLVKAVLTSKEGKTCDYGVFLDRSRDTKTLDFNHSVVLSSTNEVEGCLPAKEFLDTKFKSVNYYVSKRGIRYIAVDVINGENEVCESGNVRAVFDRRLE